MIAIWIRATELGGNDFRYDITVPFISSENFIKNNKDNISIKLITIKNCGHIPSLEKPEKFNEIVIKFPKQNN